jgi:hypothetical protein
MIPARRWLFIAVTVAALLWSAQALMSALVRFNHQHLISQIRAGKSLPNQAELAQALAGYERVLRIAPCDGALNADRMLLVAYAADRAMNLPDAEASDAALQAVERQLAQRLTCNPRDGKAWLDVASLAVVREGITPRALTAYRMSALAAPGESWLAKKRLEFAVTFLPIFTEDEIAVARNDLTVLARAHPNNLLAIQAAAKVDNAQALYALFGAKVPIAVP